MQTKSKSGILDHVPLLSAVARDLDRAWSLHNYSLDTFPKLAKKALEDLPLFLPPPLHLLVSEADKLQLPTQTYPKREFSDFPITLFRAERFCFDMYYWLRSDTTIHDHHFCGAFRVLQGRSVQVSYEFLDERPLTKNISSGLLQQKELTLLERGSTESIQKKEGFIHHVFHFDSPTVTLCLRTPNIPKTNLSTFLFPKFRIDIAAFSHNQRARIQEIFNLQCASDSDANHDEEIFTSDEFLVLLFNASLAREAVSPFAIKYLEERASKSVYFSEFLELLAMQDQMSSKLKSLGRHLTS